MKKKILAFTLVELIVTITILSILWTLAFVSLQGYSQDAKNAKVAQDISTLWSAVEIALINDVIQDLDTLVIGDRSPINWIDSSSLVTLYNDNNEASTWALDNISVKYKIGTINFPALRQNWDDFKDRDNNDYIISLAYSGSTVYYQISWQQRENSWVYLALLKGTYVPQLWDTPSLISASWSQIAITHNSTLWTDVDNTNLY